MSTIAVPPAHRTALAPVLPGLPDFLASWFRGRFGSPTAIQRLAWPALASGQHLLISAPTGTGKSLAAFLPVLADLIQAPPPLGWSDSRLRAVYVAPLKALVADVARNLEGHLTDLAPHLPGGMWRLTLALRTGDTPSKQRKQLRDDPPDILLTTPESLAVLLSQPDCSSLFANVRWAVVDEVHALVGDKRGADLAVSLERLSELAAAGVQEGGSDEQEVPRLCQPCSGMSGVRRVGLSATALPLDEAARWLAGPGRPCAVAHSGDATPPLLKVEILQEGARFLRSLVDRLVPELPSHKAVLVFTNTRSLAERLGWALRRRLPAWDRLVGVHHSALSAPRRRDVEERFKKGELRVVVSSTSLELGIDIGPVDLVVLVHPPGDVVRLLQRIGRAGHGPGRVRRGLVLASSPAELLEGAVTTASGLAAQVEPLRIPAAPLDVLCQQILGMACARPLTPDEMFALVRRSAPFASLERKDFDDALSYLRGLDHQGQSWLPARLREDGDCFRVLDARTARLLRRNLGTILAEHTVSVLVRQATSAPEAEGDEPPPPWHVGEVDEGFGERLQPGDRFLLDGRCLEYRNREEGALIVEEVPGRPRVPRWGGDGWPLSAELANRLYVLRVRAAEALREGAPALADLLRGEYGLGDEGVQVLAAYFERQECLSEIPDTRALLIEGVCAEGGATFYLHTPLNRLANDALARVAVRRLVRQRGWSAWSLIADLGFALKLKRVPEDVPGLVRQLLDPAGFDEDLTVSLADSHALRERFQRVARTGLMLLRNPEGRKRKVGGADWGERELFEQVRARDADFILLRQALREVRAGLCDGEAAGAYARSLPGLGVRCRWLRSPSPFVEAWTQLAEEPAEVVQTPAEALKELHARLMRGDAGPG